MGVDLFADWLSNAAAGGASHLGRALLSLCRPSADPDATWVLGPLWKTDPFAAALANAGAAHSLEFDDAHREALYHPGVPVFSAVWSAGAVAGASGERLLASAVAGYEISIRLARAVNPSHYSVWHTTGTVGTFGAAAASSLCLSLGFKETVCALGLAGTQAAGLWEVLPQAPEAKNLHPAKAAQSGLLSAILALKGVPGPAGILEGEKGFFAGFVPGETDEKACLDSLGSEWAILETTMKAYPVCGHTMTPLEAALALHGRFDIEAVERIFVHVHPLSAQIAGFLDPVDAHEARFSIAYCVAVALVSGRVTRREFDASMLRNEEVRRVLNCIQVEPDERMAGMSGLRPARLVVHLRDGGKLEETRCLRKGDPEQPLSALEKKQKFFDLTAEAWGENMSEIFYRAVMDLPLADNIRSWLPVPAGFQRSRGGAESDSPNSQRG